MSTLCIPEWCSSFPRKYSKVWFTGRLFCTVPARRLRLASTSGPSVFNW